MALAAAAILFASAVVAPSLFAHAAYVSGPSAGASSAAPLHSTISIDAVLPSVHRAVRPSFAQTPFMAPLGPSLLAIGVQMLSIAPLSRGSIQLLPRERRALLRVYLK